jgi:hypothetical protein
MARRAQDEPVTIAVNGGRWVRQTRDRLPFWLLLVLILLAGGLLLWGLLQFFPGLSDLRALPFAFRSPLQADYSADLRGNLIVPVSLNLLADVLYDEPGGSGGARLATIMNNLNTPVPTITSQFAASAQPSPALATAQASPTQSASPSAAAQQTETPLATASLTPTVMRSATPWPIATRSPAPGATLQPVIFPSATTLPPTEPLPSPTQSPSPTAVPPTSIPPTEAPPAYPPPGATAYPAPP